MGAICWRMWLKIIWSAFVTENLKLFTMSREQWCTEKLAKLLDEDLRISTLNEIKDHLVTLPQNEAAEVANLFQLPLVFDCLNDSNTEQVDLACDVLSLCMGNLSLGESTSRYGVPLERALNHPYTSVKLMALHEIQRNIVTDELLTDFVNRISLLNMVVKCVGNDELSVGKAAADIIIHVGLSDIGINKLLCNDVTKVIHGVMGMNEVFRLRFFEVFISVAKESESALRKLESVGFMSQILQEVDSNDILLRMNIIELLSQFVITKHGYLYLESQGIMDKFLKQFNDNSDPLFVQICEPGILKFFGKLAHWRPNEVISKHRAALDRIFSNLQSEDLTIVGISLDTLGYISETYEGKLALDSIGEDFLNIVTLIVEKLPSLPTEIRLRALNCLGSMLTVTTNDTRISNVTQKWFTVMGSHPMDLILKYAKNPFSEIRLAGLSILNVLSQQYWGQEMIRNCPGLIEFLLDRNIETIKECKEMKFEIVRNLSICPVFDHNMQLRLQAFVKEGPFYIQGVTEIAIEGNE